MGDITCMQRRGEGTETHNEAGLMLVLVFGVSDLICQTYHDIVTSRSSDV